MAEARLRRVLTARRQSQSIAFRFRPFGPFDDHGKAKGERSLTEAPLHE
jgi:hypothetical protein